MSDAAKKPNADRETGKRTAATDAAAKPTTAKADPVQAHLAAEWKCDRPLTACRFDPSGKYVFAGTEDYTIQRFRVSDGARTAFVGHESWCRAIAFLPDGKTAISGGYDGRLLWWPTTADKPTPQRAVQAHDGWIRAAAVSPDGKLVASCGNDGLVKLWNAVDGKPVRTLAGHGCHVYNVAFHPDGKHLVSCDLKALCKVWNTSDGKMEREFTAAALYRYDTQFRADFGGARSLAFGDGGKLLAAGGIVNVTNAFAGIGNAAWVVLDWASGKVKIQHNIKEKINGMGWGVAWHPDGYWIGAGGGNQGGFLYFFKPEAENEFFRLKLADTARDLSLAPDGMSAAVPHYDGNLRIYRLAAKS